MLRGKSTLQPVKEAKAKSTSSRDALLLSAEQISLLKKLNLPKGRFHRREINALLEKQGVTGWKCPYSIIRGSGMHGEGDALYAVYRDNIEDKPSIIGKGHTSKVKNVQNLETGTWSVLKILSNFDQVAENEHALLRELGKADGHLIQKDSKQHVHKREIVMEKASGIELGKLIDSRQLPTDAILLKKIAFNILRQLQALHDKNIVIRDLKHQNIIVDPKTGEATLIDFGFAMKAKNGRATDGKRWSTRAYLAPEIYFYPDNTTFTVASDVYAAGTVLRGLLTGNILTYSNEEDEFYDDYDGIKRVMKYGNMEIPYIVEQDIHDLYRRMRHDDARMRPGLTEACDILQRHIPKEPSIKAVKTPPRGLFYNEPQPLKKKETDAQPADNDSLDLFLKAKGMTL